MSKDKENKTAGNPVFILIIFAALIIFLFVLPDIYQKYNKEIADILGIGTNTNKKEENTNPEIDGTSEIYQISENKSFNYNELKIKNVLLENETLKITIQTEELINLEAKNYYIEFYENKSKFLGRRILKSNIKGSHVISVDTEGMPVDETTYFTICHISDDAIPKKELPTDESGLASIVCEKNNKKYAYDFYLSNLSKVMYEEKITDFESDEYIKFEYQKTVNKYNSIEGVTASIIDSEDGFSFIAEFDYNIIKNTADIKTEHLYKKDSKANIVLYKMDAEGFICKWIQKKWILKLTISMDL